MAPGANSSQVHTRMSLEPPAMRFLRFSLMISFPAESPAAAFLSERSSAPRSFPALFLYNGNHSEGALNKKAQLRRASMGNALCCPLVETN